eukprot:jgi/Undpi1/2232/HiC_scaffold_12.g05618.m1
MSVSPSLEANGAYIFDASTFFKGLRSISLRNLSLRNVSPGTTTGTKGNGERGERDSGSVTSASLHNLRAVIRTNDVGGVPASEVNGTSTPPAATATGKTLLTTAVSQPTVNPTWAVSEISWMLCDVSAEDLEGSRSLLLQVLSVDSCPQAGREARQPPLGLGRRVELDDGPVVWECVIDVRGLTALPAGSRLSHLWMLPADCLLLEMSNGGLYAPAWVVQALESNSALPVAVKGTRGASGGDPWRNDSDEDDDDEQEPLEEVIRKVTAMEKEAERCRAELTACLEQSSSDDRRAFEAAEIENAMEMLTLERSAQEELLQTEEALLEREKRLLLAEALAVEQLMEGFSAAEEAAAAGALELKSEKRDTLKSHVLLEARRARLTSELQASYLPNQVAAGEATCSGISIRVMAIYPIKYHEKLREYTIRGLELPADLYSVDDERISSALGYTAHLVCMLAKYLQVPLRYQLIYNASRSAVRDNVTGAGVAYPLFRRGVEKERFDRGVYLLGRNVEQMLTSRGVPAKRGGGQLLRNLERLMVVEGA